MDWLPLVALAPRHAPDALHLLASVELHTRVDDPPLATEAGRSLQRAGAPDDVIRAARLNVLEAIAYE